MDIIEFEGREFAEEIYLEPGNFEVICFKGLRNTRLEISAWEMDREQFDILLVSPSDIMEDQYREERARLADWNCSDFEETYTFDRNQRLCLVISNVRAISKEKIVKIRLSWVIHHESDEVPKATSQSKKGKKPPEKKPKDENIPEGIREFIMRKMIQALLLAIPISIFVYLITVDQYVTYLALAGCIIGLLVGTLFELLYYYAIKDTSLQRYVALIVLAAYVTIFILIAGFYLEAVYLQLGYITNIILLISLLVTELVARWGPLKHLLKIMDYINSGIILILFFVAAQIVSILIGESVWVVISVIAALFAIYDRQAKSSDD